MIYDEIIEKIRQNYEMKTNILKKLDTIPALKERIIINKDDKEAFEQIRAIIFLAHFDCLVMKDEKNMKEFSKDIQEYYALCILDLFEKPNKLNTGNFTSRTITEDVRKSYKSRSPILR